MLKRVDSHHQEQLGVQLSKRFSALIPLFSTCPEIRRVFVFGSRARGDYEERSDIDLAIDAPTLDIVQWDKLCQYITENSKTLLQLDLTWMQQASGRLMEKIQTEGVIVFARKDEAIR